MPYKSFASKQVAYNLNAEAAVHFTEVYYEKIIYQRTFSLIACSIW